MYAGNFTPSQTLEWLRPRGKQRVFRWGEWERVDDYMYVVTEKVIWAPNVRHVRYLVPESELRVYVPPPAPPPRPPTQKQLRRKAKMAAKAAKREAKTAKKCERAVQVNIMSGKVIESTAPAIEPLATTGKPHYVWDWKTGMPGKTEFLPGDASNLNPEDEINDL